MMEVTNRHFRYMLRLLTKRTELYTEMYVDKHLIHTKKPIEQEIGGYPGERDTIIQITGNKPEEIGKAAKLCAQVGYKGINVNCGCPSKKANNHHGAYLMKDPLLVRSLLESIIDSTKDYGEIEYSVKCRIGVDELDSYEYLSNFIHTTSQSGVNNYIIHARKAMLKLDTKDNLKVPPINYEFATKLVSDFPHINFVINGEIKLLQDVKYFLDRGFKGVMFGRIVRDSPWFLSAVDKIIDPNDKSEAVTRRKVLLDYNEYAKGVIERENISTTVLFMPIINLINKKAFSKVILDKNVPLHDKITTAMKTLPEDFLDYHNDEHMNVKW